MCVLTPKKGFMRNEQCFTMCSGPLSLGHDSIHGCSVIWGIFDNDPITHLLDFSHHSWRIADTNKEKSE